MVVFILKRLLNSRIIENMNLVKKFLFILFFILQVNILIAQPGGGPPPPAGEPVPLTGAEYLLAAGALFGLNKIRKSFKAKSS